VDHALADVENCATTVCTSSRYHVCHYRVWDRVQR